MQKRLTNILQKHPIYMFLFTFFIYLSIFIFINVIVYLANSFFSFDTYILNGLLLVLSILCILIATSPFILFSHYWTKHPSLFLWLLTISSLFLIVGIIELSHSLSSYIPYIMEDFSSISKESSLAYPGMNYSLISSILTVFITTILVVISTFYVRWFISKKNNNLL